MARRVFRYRFDFKQDVVRVRAEGRTKRGAYYALASTVSPCDSKVPGSRSTAVLACMDSLKANEALKI